MNVEEWPIERVKPYPGNPRVNEQAVETVKQSLLAYQFRQPIVVDGEGVIVVGHTRWRAALELGLKKVPVKVAANLSEAEARAYRIADNKIPESSEWDFKMLKAELEDLQRLGFDVDLTGLPRWEIDTLRGAEGEGTGAGRGADGNPTEHRIMMTQEQEEIVQRAVAALDPPAEDVARGVVRICERYVHGA